MEFCSREFVLFCAKNGIKRQHIVPITPQQNGIAERMNRTLLKKARCLLFNSGMKSSSLWGEVVVTSAYIINRLPCSAINYKIPRKLWISRKFTLKHLRPFECVAYWHVSQGKQASRAIKCGFLGYPMGTKGYKLLVIQQGGYKVIISRSVFWWWYFLC